MVSGVEWTWGKVEVCRRLISTLARTSLSVEGAMALLGVGEHVERFLLMRRWVDRTGCVGGAGLAGELIEVS